MLRTGGYKQLKGYFFTCVVPSVVSQLLGGIYTIVDGYFIGRGVGEDGIAAVGLAYPFALFVTAVGTGIGVGGGALLSISRGRGRARLAERILGVMACLMLLVSLVGAPALTISGRYLLSRFAVESQRVSDLASLYATIMLAGAPAQIVTMGMLGAARNDGFPRKAMLIMCTGFFLNIFLDWLLVISFGFGVSGAALATVFSQLLTAVLLFAHFVSGYSVVALRRCMVRFNGGLSARILMMGLPSFGVQIATALAMLMHNWQALAFGGDLGVAAYAVIGYIVPVGVMLQDGIAEGIQPIISYCHGAGLYARRAITARLGFVSVLAVGMLCSMAAVAMSGVIPAFFSLHGAAADLAERGIMLSAAMFPFLGVTKVGASYFQSVGSLGMASLFTYGEPFVLLPLFLWLLPAMWGLDGVWTAMTAANIALCGVFVIMWRAENGARVYFSVKAM